MRIDAEGLLPAQIAMLATQLRDPDNPAYLLRGANWIHGDIDIPALHQAVIDVSAEISILGGVLHRDEHGRIVHRPDTIDTAAELELVDFRNHDDPEAAYTQWKQDTSATPLPLFDGPLARHAIAILDDRKVGHIADFQHVAVDGYTMFLLNQRLLELYRARRDGAEPATPAMADHREVLASVTATPPDNLDFWARYLTDPPREVALVADTARPSVTRRCHIVEIPDLRRIDKGNWIHRVMGAIATYCTRFLDTEESLLGIPRANRRSRLDRAVPAMMMSVLPIRVATTDSDTVADVAARVRDALRDTQAHSDIRADELVDVAPGAWQSGRLHGPVVNVLPFAIEMDATEVESSVEIISRGPIDDLTITITPTGVKDGRIEFDFNPGLYSATDAELHGIRMAAWIQTWARATQSDPVSKLQFLTDDDRAAAVMSCAPGEDTQNTGLRPAAESELTAATLRALTTEGSTAFSVRDSRGRLVPRGRHGVLHQRGGDGTDTGTAHLTEVTPSGWRYLCHTDERIVVKGRAVNLHLLRGRLLADDRVADIRIDGTRATLLVSPVTGIDPVSLRKDLRFRVPRGVKIEII